MRVPSSKEDNFLLAHSINLSLAQSYLQKAILTKPINKSAFPVAVDTWLFPHTPRSISTCINGYSRAPQIILFDNCYFYQQVSSHLGTFFYFCSTSETSYENYKQADKIDVKTEAG